MYICIHTHTYGERGKTHSVNSATLEYLDYYIKNVILMVSLINYLDEYFLEGSAEGRSSPVWVESSGGSDVRRSMRKEMFLFSLVHCW